MILDSEAFNHPRPRPPRSSSRAAQIRIQNRRREYLTRNPSYFSSREHELADPLLYDALIRRFLTPQEREAEGRAMGYARVLEGSLVRGEERLARLGRERGEPSDGVPGGMENDVVPRSSGMESDEVISSTCENGVSAGNRCQNGAGGGMERKAAVVNGMGSLAEEEAETAKTKEDGRERWEEFLRERFIRGGDEDFEYEAVDKEEEFDVLEREEREDAWFNEESPGWADDDDGGSGEGRPARILTGQTGVQDF